jgi:hypothetical protein
MGEAYILSRVSRSDDFNTNHWFQASCLGPICWYGNSFPIDMLSKFYENNHFHTAKMRTTILSNSLVIYVLQLGLFISKSSSDKPIFSTVHCVLDSNPSHHKGPAAAIPGTGPFCIKTRISNSNNIRRTNHHGLKHVR